MSAQSEEGRELSVTAIRNGTVIDHIRNEATFKVAEVLRVQEEDSQVLVGMNLPSGRVGRKGIIKVENRELTPQEVNKIALIAPEATVNIIKDFEVVDKRYVEVQDRVTGIVKCFNPNCITNRQDDTTTAFRVVGEEPTTLRCIYCERHMAGNDIIIK
jgi:aspartate carbamoyltransferase regulatory subunit